MIKLYFTPIAFQIFKEGKLSHFIDGRGATGNWMSYVNCARHGSEQNLTVVQDGTQIYYEVKYYSTRTYK